MNIEDYRTRITQLDILIVQETDVDKKVALIDENIKCNEEYIKLLLKPIPIKIVFCVILSILYLLGLAIFLPQILVRKNKARICRERIASLEELKKSLGTVIQEPIIQDDVVEE